MIVVAIRGLIYRCTRAHGSESIHHGALLFMFLLRFPEAAALAF